MLWAGCAPASQRKPRKARWLLRLLDAWQRRLHVVAGLNPAARGWTQSEVLQVSVDLLTMTFYQLHHHALLRIAAGRYGVAGLVDRIGVIDIA